METESFNVGLGRVIVIITTAVYVLMLALTVTFAVLYFKNSGKGAVSFAFLYPGILCFLLMVLGPLLRVKGYELSGNTLRVSLGYGSTSFPLEGLKSVRRCPEAFEGGIRTMGNGGVFSFLGRFRSDPLGPFRAYVTDRETLVLLEWEAEKVVLSPADPERFVAAVQEKTGGATP